MSKRQANGAGIHVMREGGLLAQNPIGGFGGNPACTRKHVGGKRAISIRFLERVGEGQLARPGLRQSNSKISHIGLATRLSCQRMEHCCAMSRAMYCDAAEGERVPLAVQRSPRVPSSACLALQIPGLHRACAGVGLSSKLAKAHGRDPACAAAAQSSPSLRPFKRLLCSQTKGWLQVVC